MKKLTTLVLTLCLLLTASAMAENTNMGANELVALIDSIDGATIENEDAIDEAYYAYYQLPEEEKANVTNWDTLLALREELPKAYVVGERQGTRVPWHKLKHGVYACTFPNFEEHAGKEKAVADMSALGLDFAISIMYNQEYLDLMEQYGLGAIVELVDTTAAWNYQLQTWEEVDGEYVEVVSDDEFRAILNSETPYEHTDVWYVRAEDLDPFISDHAAIWGAELHDESVADLLPFLGRNAKLLLEKYPDWMYYQNLFPNYVSANQLGAESYEEYIRLYHEYVDTDYTCYDHYMYAGQAMGRGNLMAFIDNLEMVANTNRDLGKETWIVIQANQEATKPIGINKMKLQAYLAMAYGAKTIIWGCWSDYGWTWYSFNITDAEGNPTQRYWDVQEVIADTAALGPVFMRYTWQDTCAIGNINQVLELDYEIGSRSLSDGISPDNSLYDRKGSQTELSYKVDHAFLEQNDVTLGQDVFADFAVADETAAVLIGGFKKSVGEGSAVMLVNITNHNFNKKGTMFESDDIDLSCTVTFTVNQPDAVVTCYVKGIPEILTPVDGVYTVNLNTADAAFVTVE